MARWATILLLSHQGRSVQEIAAGLGLHVQTVRARLRAFNAADRHQRWGLLRPPRRPGRRPTYGPDVQRGLVDLLKQAPEKFGVDSGVWRLHDLVAVAKQTGLVRGPAAQTFNVEAVRRLLRKAGYVYLSAKWWLTSDDPHYQHKKARRDKLLAWAKRDPSISRSRNAKNRLFSHSFGSTPRQWLSWCGNVLKPKTRQIALCSPGRSAGRVAENPRLFRGKCTFVIY